MDFWLRMFRVLGVARFNAGDDAGGDEADALAIMLIYGTNSRVYSGHWGMSEYMVCMERSWEGRTRVIGGNADRVDA